MFQEFLSHDPIYVGSFLNPMCILVRILINKPDLIPNWKAGLVVVFRNGRGLRTGESCIPVFFFHPLHHRSPCFPNVDREFCTIRQ